MYTIYNSINAFVYLMSASYLKRHINDFIKTMFILFWGKCSNLKTKCSFVRDA